VGRKSLGLLCCYLKTAVKSGDCLKEVMK